MNNTLYTCHFIDPFMYRIPDIWLSNSLVNGVNYLVSVNVDRSFVIYR